MEELFLVAIGGYVGANLRFFVSTFLPGLSGTFFVNVVGSFLLGFLLYEAAYTGILAEKSIVVFGAGFLSSFTTYSTFAFESVQTTPLVGVVNVVGSYTMGFVAVLVGRHFALSIEEAS
ncbi:CrcB family protein [Halomicrococcus sp. NG-SE-24]|uniref:CrcB family protein n=1 Tax=Halomicrococcus sp. NG-SE-24 TaxID=3436928 RepID=UPI003D95C452